MDRSSISEIAECLVASYRDTLCLDPFFKIKVEIVAGSFISTCEVDKESTASWILKLNPDKHSDFLDIKQSVVDCLVKIVFRYVESNNHIEEALARITTAFCLTLPDLNEDSETDNNEV